MLLALETSSESGGVALLEGDEILGEAPIGGREPQHAAALLPAVDALLAGAGRQLDEVDLIAVSVGPGSFTGLRIGLATALGLCFGTGRQIVPVPTLAALAASAGDVSPIAPMLDARRGQLYTGLYDGSGAVLHEDCVTDPLPWLAALAALPGADPVWLLGPGAHLYRNEIEVVLGRHGRLLDVETGRPRAANVGRLGARLAREGGALPPEQITLRYLRRAEAEDKRRAGQPPR